MRAKNGFHCSLMSSYPYSLDNIRDALRFYRKEFEFAAASGHMLRFEISSLDEKVLRTFFAEERILVPGRLQMLFNDALDDNKMPFAVLSVLRVVKTPRFYCRIIRFDWYKMKMVSEG